jgi:hypothetical protein
VAAGDSFLATQIAFLVISGVSVVVLVSGGIWVMVRTARALAAYGRTVLLPTLAGRLVSRRFRALPAGSSTPVAGAAHKVGSLVRLRGKVEAEAVHRAEFSGAPSVICSHEFGEVGGGGEGHGLIAQDFLLRLDDGGTVRVRARDAADRKLLALVDRQPQRWRGQGGDGWFWESRLSPGDEIEVIGCLQRELDSSAPRVSDRQPALGWSLMAGPAAGRGRSRGGLFLCFVTRPAVCGPHPRRALPVKNRALG